MNVVNMNQAAKEPLDNALFTNAVALQTLAPDSREFDVNVVHFDKGVRNKFHAHDGDQVLIVTHGRGIIATREEERIIGVGDVVYIPANEVHWHGAASDSDFAHIYIVAHQSRLVQHED